VPHLPLAGGGLAVDATVQLLTFISALVAALGGAVAARRHIPVRTGSAVDGREELPGGLPAWPVFALAGLIFAVAMALLIVAEV
jgi:uncharacterized membrane protein YidH (DUF202 family)